MSSTSVQIEKLNINELTILLGHLRLGENHLKEKLNRQQYKSLLRLASVNMFDAQKINMNLPEKIGNISLGLNTVVTSTFGAWMGFSAFLGLRLNSTPILSMIILLAVVACLFVGYFSAKITRNNARSAIVKQKIHNLQKIILQQIINKQQKELDSLNKFLNYSLRYIHEKSTFPLPLFEQELPQASDRDVLENFSYWISRLSSAIKLKAEVIADKKIYTFYSLRLLKILQKLEKIAKISAEYEPNKQSSAGQSSFVEVLSSQNQFVYQRGRKNWLRENALVLAAGGITTLFGSFASMFVFLAGAPNVAKEFGFTELFLMLTRPGARILEFTIALSLTTYYAISFVYSNYKNYLRGDILAHTRKELVALEEEELKLQKKISLLRKIKVQARRIINIYTAIENIAYYRETNAYSNSGNAR